MKFNFKKIGSILASGIMLASTIGFAAAASYPEPFVTGGTAEGAVVVGANAATTDWAAAIDLQTNLNSVVTTGSVAGGASAAGGDSYKFEKASTKFHMGMGVRDVVTVAVTEDDMPSLLKDGKYIDDDNDEFDYTQEIKVANLSLGMFDDNDYAEDTPTVGFRIPNGRNILNFTLAFSDEPLWTDLATTTIPLMGKEYYVLTTNSPGTNTSITLLDSAVDTVLSEGETATLDVSGKGYESSIAFVSSTEVKLVVNGETTSSLQESETQKLADGSYLGIKDIMYDSKDTGVSKVEFSIGKGKLKLTEGSNLEVNDDTVSSLTANVSSTTSLKRIKIIWAAEEDMFITKDSEITMPTFESVKLSFGGMVYPAEEEIKIESDGSNSIVLKEFPLKDSVEDINILWTNSTGAYNGTGKDADNLLRTPGGSSNGALGSGEENGSFSNITFDSDTDDYFVASWNDSTSAESYLMRVTNWKIVSGIEKATFQYKKGGEWTDAKTDAKNGTSFSLGNVEITVGQVDKTNKRIIVAPTVGTSTNFNQLYSKEEAMIYLPWINVTHYPSVNTTAHASCVGNISTPHDNIGQVGTTMRYQQNATESADCNNFRESYNLYLKEEDKDGNLAKGKMLNITLGETSTNSEVKVSDITGEDGTSGGEEIGDTDEYRSFMYGHLATEIYWDQGPTRRKLKIIYHGDEAYGELFLTSPETIITPGSTASADGGQVIVVKDSEVSSVASKNLIVIGGSCINTVAAKILGSTTPLCTSAFTEKTGAGAGQYIIKTVTSPYNDNKVAMLVAGYEAADTVSAVAKAKESSTSDVGTSQVYPIVAA